MKHAVWQTVLLGVIALIVPVLVGYDVYFQWRVPLVDIPLDWESGEILDVFPDTYGDYAGFWAGDVILSVDGIPALRRAVCFALLLALCCAGCADWYVTYTDINDAIRASENVERRLEKINGKYILGATDSIQLIVRNGPNLSGSHTIRPDGYISVPLLPEPVLASGMTLLELENYLEERVGDYLVIADIFLNLVTLGSQQIFVLGEVRNPQIVKGQPITLASALSECGGLTKEARAGQILVIRHWNQENPVVFEIDFDAFLDGQSIFPDMPLQRYDVVIVPKSRILACDDFINLVFTRGIYGVVPLDVRVNFAKLSSI